MKTKLNQHTKYAIRQAKANSKLENFSASSDGAITKSLVRMARGEVSLDEHIRLIKSCAYGTR